MPLNPPFLGMVPAAGATAQPATGSSTPVHDPHGQIYPDPVTGIFPYQNILNRGIGIMSGVTNPYPPGTPEFYQWERDHAQQTAQRQATQRGVSAGR